MLKHWQIKLFERKGDPSLAGAYGSCLFYLEFVQNTRNGGVPLSPPPFHIRLEDALPPETGSDQPAPPCAEPPTGDTSSRRLETATCLVSSGPAASVCGGGAGSTFPVRGDTGEVLPLLPLPPQLTGFLWPSNKSK
ncbi:hypothetical protein BHE74_00044813 [Ensete ventricosum]|nr:hypothetical protein BHE74_00044813 [Ensete ventricosum]